MLVASVLVVIATALGPLGISPSPATWGSYGPSAGDCADAWNGADNAGLRALIARSDHDGAVVTSSLTQEVYAHCYVTLVSDDGRRRQTYERLVSENLPVPPGWSGPGGTASLLEPNLSVKPDGTIELGAPSHPSP